MLRLQQKSKSNMPQYNYNKGRKNTSLEYSTLRNELGRAGKKTQDDGKHATFHLTQSVKLKGIRSLLLPMTTWISRVFGINLH